MPCKQQTYKNLDGKNILVISGVTVPAFSTVEIKLVKGEASAESEIVSDGNKISTPFAEIELNEKIILILILISEQTDRSEVRAMRSTLCLSVKIYPPPGITGISMPTLNASSTTRLSLSQAKLFLTVRRHSLSETNISLPGKQP